MRSRLRVVCVVRVVGVVPFAVVVALLAGCCGSDEPPGREPAAHASSDSGPASWRDIQPCRLLPAGALAATGIENADGEPGGAVSASDQACHWGQRFDAATSYVEVALWDPGYPDVFDNYRQIDVAGRPAYTLNPPDATRSCTIDVDNGDHFLTVVLESAPSVEPPACDLATSLAATALSSL